MQQIIGRNATVAEAIFDQIASLDRSAIDRWRVATVVQFTDSKIVGPNPKSKPRSIKGGLKLKAKTKGRARWIHVWLEWDDTYTVERANFTNRVDYVIEESIRDVYYEQLVEVIDRLLERK